MHDGRGRPSDDPGPRSGGSFFFETSRERRVRCDVSQSPVRVSAKHFHISPPDIMYVFPVFLDMYILTLYNACACDVPWWMTEFCFLASREKNALPFAVGTKKKCNDTIVISSKRRAMATVQNLRFFCTWFCGRRKDAARSTQNHLIRVFGPSLQQKMSIKSVWPFGRSSYVEIRHVFASPPCADRGQNNRWSPKTVRFCRKTKRLGERACLWDRTECAAAAARPKLIKLQQFGLQVVNDGIYNSKWDANFKTGNLIVGIKTSVTSCTTFTINSLKVAWNSLRANNFRPNRKLSFDFIVLNSRG
jgi:hypothetical protein